MMNEKYYNAMIEELNEYAEWERKSTIICLPLILVMLIMTLITIAVKGWSIWAALSLACPAITLFIWFIGNVIMDVAIETLKAKLDVMRCFM